MKNYLTHYGIPRQKWGERRYQYYDGSLTPEGRIRYGVGPARDKKINDGRQRTGSLFRNNLRKLKNTTSPDGILTDYGKEKYISLKEKLDKYEPGEKNSIRIAEIERDMSQISGVSVTSRSDVEKYIKMWEDFKVDAINANDLATEEDVQYANTHILLARRELDKYEEFLVKNGIVDTSGNKKPIQTAKENVEFFKEIKESAQKTIKYMDEHNSGDDSSRKYYENEIREAQEFIDKYNSKILDDYHKRGGKLYTSRQLNLALDSVKKDLSEYRKKPFKDRDPELEDLMEMEIQDLEQEINKKLNIH